MLRLPKFEYRAARTVAEALEWMGDLAGVGERGPEARAMLMAGGTDVLPNMKQRIFTPSVGVGLRAIPALRGIVFDSAHGLRIGAGESLAALAASPLVCYRIPPSAGAPPQRSKPQLPD